MLRKRNQIRELTSNLDQPWDENSITLPILYNSSFGQSEVRCRDAADPLRSVSLSYSYLVQSSGNKQLESIDAALLSSVAENVLECKKPVSYGYSRATIVALRSSLDDSIMSVNYCKSGVFCNVFRRTMTVDIYGGHEEEDDLVLQFVYSAIEDSIDWLSFEGQNAIYIKERPTIAQAQSLNVPAEENLDKEFSVFAGALIVISGVGSIVAVTIIRFHIRAISSDFADETLERQARISNTTHDSSGKSQPSERCKDIIPRNLDIEEFVFVAEEETWMRTGIPSARNGLCLFLDTVIEEDESSSSFFVEDEEISI
ncbi:hypothetical protein HJC23_007035 [Cyclotella cryptica]|uniref:Uncharacterized protein n=1 Tax=Cyclotella cryptica TaxID=29204 RepID=A0ABD3QMC7_9STRA